MKWLNKLMKVAALTIIFQLVADHIIRMHMDGAAYIFVAAVAGACGLLALLIVQLIGRRAG